MNTRGLSQQIRDRLGSASRLDYTYSYDQNGNLTNITDAVDGEENRTLTYDARDRLITAHAPGKWGDQVFEYDALDNVRRLGLIAAGANTYLMDYRYQYDANWRLDKLTDPSGDMHWDYTVNGYGETTYRKAVYDYGGTSGLTWNYSWDAAGRMTSGGTETYRYDAHGRRTKSTRPNGVRYQVYSRSGQLVYTQDSEDNKRIEYISLSGRPVAQRSRPLSTNTVTTTYLHTDQRGSVNVETDQWGNQSNRTLWMPYGAPAWGDFRPGLGFTGHQIDPHTSLIYMQQRHLDPVGMRFLSTDPVDVNPANGGNFNRFWYANNNPYRFIDPDGRDPCTDRADCARRLALADQARGRDGRILTGIVAGTAVAGASAASAAAAPAVAAAVTSNALTVNNAAVTVGEIVAGDATGGAAIAASAGKVAYEVVDGVRRSKAAEMIGNSVINAVDTTGKKIAASIESLFSPNKASIDVSTSGKMDRFMSVLEGDVPPL